ncbi:hypothetical protein EFA69_02560 [Rufibacter immobilis]|uniref:Uncharacterized protein n=1 Tax=Rufibacter immobilis TaxID=1348778 RepID=A0A3M9N5F5_9BACT|nr:hypothetical protein [Rufibacter immobilis]RNI32228.1 hypothetical protein EFA69_02560 [Rufibacter immobilis]
MKSKLIFILGLLFTAFGVAPLFFDMPFQGKNASFVEGGLLGLGLAMMVTAFVKRKQEQGQ